MPTASALLGTSKAKSKFKGPFLYTGGILFHVEWCIR